MGFDLLPLLTRTGALLSGHFRLSSGLHSSSYVQCALLLEDPRNAKVIGETLGARLREFEAKRVVSPALGGVIIGYTVAEALEIPMAFTERKDGEMTLRRGFRVVPGERVVIVEDVVTTGKSTREAAAAIEQRGGRVIGYGSILNRSGMANPFDAPYEALLALALDAWPEAGCPLCHAHKPIDSPGSRYSGASK
ncbi:MAG TPA: orotate phosphoribosyltransferase [Thermoanaerobaculia bacterium]|nr:orotate phosphoribosyltransferase [Thermoanaerobaculia bacterium]